LKSNINVAQRVRLARADFSKKILHATGLWFGHPEGKVLQFGARQASAAHSGVMAREIRALDFPFSS
jgi:hypothetical protein